METPRYVRVQDLKMFQKFRDLVRDLYGREAGFIGKEATEALRAWIPDLEQRLQEREELEQASHSFES